MTNAKKMFARAKVNKAVFMAVLLAFPLTQFFVFYILVNGNSILLSFKEYTGDSVFKFVGFKNFTGVLNSFRYDAAMRMMLKNSLLMAVFGLFMIAVNCIVTYLIFKKSWGSGFFKVVLFLPSVISVVVYVVIYKNFILFTLPKMSGIETAGQIMVPPTAFTTILIIGGLLNFGPALLVFLGAMSSVPDSVLEYGKLDGVGLVREFCCIIVPFIWPTVISYTVLTLATFFSNYGLIFVFYEAGRADVSVSTLGYNIFSRVYSAVNYYEYPALAAAGLLFTFVTIPVVFGAKALMEKLGPKE